MHNACAIGSELPVYRLWSLRSPAPDPEVTITTLGRRHQTTRFLATLLTRRLRHHIRRGNQQSQSHPLPFWISLINSSQLTISTSVGLYRYTAHSDAATRALGRAGQHHGCAQLLICVLGVNSGGYVPQLLPKTWRSPYLLRAKSLYGFINPLVRLFFLQFFTKSACLFRHISFS